MSSAMYTISDFRDHEVKHSWNKFISSELDMIKSIFMSSAILEKVSMCVIDSFLTVETLISLRASV